jgi:hypothetical protein
MQLVTDRSTWFDRPKLAQELEGRFLRQTSCQVEKRRKRMRMRKEANERQVKGCRRQRTV